MHQLEIQYFFPLTEQVALDLDFTPCKEYEAEKQRQNYSLINPDEEKKQALYYSKLNTKFQFLDPAYPFLHTLDTSNVLGPYFKTMDRNPNIVFIISESLSSVLSGTKTKWGSPSQLPKLPRCALRRA